MAEQQDQESQDVDRDQQPEKDGRIIITFKGDGSALFDLDLEGSIHPYQMAAAAAVLTEQAKLQIDAALIQARQDQLARRRGLVDPTATRGGNGKTIPWRG